VYQSWRNDLLIPSITLTNSFYEISLCFRVWLGVQRFRRCPYDWPRTTSTNCDAIFHRADRELGYVSYYVTPHQATH
jgi:hypothetical protein